MPDVEQRFAELRARARALSQAPPPEGAAHVRYDAETDVATVRFGLAARRQEFEPLPDVTLFFDADALGRLVGVRVGAPVFARRARWQDVVADYTGPTVWQAVLAHVDDPEEGEEVTIPDEELAQLRGEVWPEAHRRACALAGLPFPERAEPAALKERILGWLGGFTAVANAPLGTASSSVRDAEAGQGDITDKAPPQRPPRRAPLPPTLAEACGVQPAYWLERRPDGGLTLVLHVVDADKAARLAVWAVDDDLRDLPLVVRGDRLLVGLDPIEGDGDERYPLLRFVPGSEVAR